MEGYSMQYNSCQALTTKEQGEQDPATYVDNAEETEREEEVLFFDNFDFNEGYLMLYD